MSSERRRWYFERKVNVSVLVQLVFLASLILGSYVNLQRQLDLMSKDVAQLLECQRMLSEKLENVWVQTIGHEYRLQAMEQKEKCEIKSNGG